MRGPERLAPRSVRGKRHHRPVRIADVRIGRPVRLVRRIERVVHETIGSGEHAVHARRHLTVQPDRRSERPAGDFEAADERGEHGACPHAFVAAPAVVHGLAEAHRDRAVRHADALDLDRLADARVIDEFVRDSPDRPGRDVADRFRPFGRVRRHVGDELAESRFAFDPSVAQDVTVRADFDSVGLKAAFECLREVRRVVRRRGAARAVPHQRLARVPVAQVVPARSHQVRRGRVPRQERHVEPLARNLVQQHVNERIQERDVGLRFDRHPLGGTGAGDREMRLDLNPFHPAHPRIGVTPDPDDTAGSLDISPAGDQIVAKGRVGRHRERAMPELAIEVFRVVTLDALPRSEAHVDRAPGGEECREGAHVRLWRAGSTQAHREPRIARCVGQAGGADFVELRSHEIECLVPRNGHEARILVATLLRVAAPHRRQHAVRVVGLLHQPVRLHADLAAARMHIGRAEIRLHLGGHTVDDFDGEQIGPGNALVAVRRDAQDAFGRMLQASPAFFDFAARRASVALTSTTKR